MRDINAKIKTLRMATARATLRVRPETLAAIRERRVPKGDPLEISKAAAIMAAKNTSQILPYCHPVLVEHVDVQYELGADRIDVEVSVKVIHKTGVEMEALTAAAAAALNLYDMLKMLDDEMEIVGVRLVSKKGGKTDFRNVYARALRAGVLVMSDTVAAGKKEDKSGRLIAERLGELGLEVARYEIVPDDAETIVARLLAWSDEEQLDLVLTTGGTGLSPRDVTPEAMGRVIGREAPGIAEAARAFGQERTPYAMLSRGRAGLRGGTLIVNLPGSSGGVRESLDALFPYLLHAFKIMRGGGHETK
ncbi:MAG TPA: bifunctional molybdenum cofactor biosynthesis protein MoaC/MoaB [Candidatus Sumerlaeota bacterium]|nr:bifunctional molybdenum cofactor biosynthesis protein MoaC/MoaB [Candidatus Sumerlaeota bacterium]